MTPTLRNLTLWIAAVSVAGFGAASVASYRPNGATDRTLAVTSLRQALAALDDESLGPTARLSAYREGLSRTDTLLRRSLRSTPTDTQSIERLATVRWETGVVEGGPDIDGVSALMAIAATRGPRVPELQVDLGELFYKMGRPDQAAAFMKRAVELSPSMTNRVVAIMQDSAIEPGDIVHVLPRVPDVLIAVKNHFLASNRGNVFLDLVESDLDHATPELLASYGEACLQLLVPNRLRAQIEQLSPAKSPAIMAERERQAGHALFALGLVGEALERANAARRIMPEDASYEEFYGEIALAAGRSSDSVSAFRRSLSIAVDGGATTRIRARLYGEIGRALEAEGHGDLAVAAYRHAIALDPTEPYALSRLTSLDAAVAGQSSR